MIRKSSKEQGTTDPKGRPDPISDFIAVGEWGPAFNAQNRMLDAYAEKYNPQDQDWRPEKTWYKPSK